jgi:hypothetical protein
MSRGAGVVSKDEFGLISKTGRESGITILSIKNEFLKRYQLV